MRLEQITVYGFLELLRIWHARVQEEKGRLGDLTDEAVLRMDAREQFIRSAALFASDEQPDFYASWATNANNRRMIAALSTIHNWPRIFSCLELSGKPTKGAGIMGDVTTIARILGTSPMDVLGWPMESFLDMTDSILRSLKAEERADDPTLDPNCDASVTGLPGIEVIH